ncbi:MAG TPA: hypothetical protein VGI54_03230, partial [Solirubrobacteraceae bacterium]
MSTGIPSPLDPALRECGATMTDRGGRAVAAHFGSATTEAAVCLSAVGMADRCDRTTLEVSGAPEVVDQALDVLAADGDRAWSARVGAGRALVRCERGHARATRRALERSGVALVLDLEGELAAIGLLGPNAAAMLHAFAEGPRDEATVVVTEGEGRYEVLTPVAHGV